MSQESRFGADGRYAVVIIGGGPAGLGAALMLGRARRSVLVIDNGEPRNAPAAHMHGYLSRDGTSPGVLLAAGRDEVAGYGGEIVTGRAESAVRDGDGLPAGRFGLRQGLTKPATPTTRRSRGRYRCAYVTAAPAP